MTFGTVRATRNFAAPSGPPACIRCGLPVSERGRRCADCRDVARPLGKKMLARLEREDREAAVA